MSLGYVDEIKESKQEVKRYFISQHAVSYRVHHQIEVSCDACGLLSFDSRCPPDQPLWLPVRQRSTLVSPLLCPSRQPELGVVEHQDLD